MKRGGLGRGLASLLPGAAQVGGLVEIPLRAVAPNPKPFKVLLAASEVVGFAKTGGLADVTGSLPRALARRGHTCAVIMPLYRCARTGCIPVMRFCRVIGIRCRQRSWRCRR